MVLHSLPIFLALWATSPSQPLPMRLSEMLLFPEVQDSLLYQSTFLLIWLHPLIMYHLIQKQCSQFFHINRKVVHNTSLGLETGIHTPIKTWLHYLASSETEASLWTSILSFSFLTFFSHSDFTFQVQPSSWFWSQDQQWARQEETIPIYIFHLLLSPGTFKALP